MADFHNPFKNSVHNLKKQEQQTPVNKAVEHLEVSEISVNEYSVVSIPTKPWPATLPEQVRAVAEVLAASPIPPNLPAIEVRFKGKGPWKKGLPLLLQTLQALDRAWPGLCQCWRRVCPSGGHSEGRAVCVWRGQVHHVWPVG